MNDKVWRGLKSLMYFECVFVGITCGVGMAGIWPLFSALALVCILVPIWIVAGSLVVLAARAVVERESKKET